MAPGYCLRSFLGFLLLIGRCDRQALSAVRPLPRCLKEDTTQVSVALVPSGALGFGEGQGGRRVTTDFTARGTWLESHLWGFQHGAGLGNVVQLRASASFSCEVSPDFSAPGGPPGAFASIAPACLE